MGFFDLSLCTSVLEWKIKPLFVDIYIYHCSLKNWGAKALISKAYDVSKAINVDQSCLTRNTKSKVTRWGKIPKSTKILYFFFLVTLGVSKVTFANVISFLGDHRNTKWGLLFSAIIYNLVIDLCIKNHTTSLEGHPVRKNSAIRSRMTWSTQNCITHCIFHALSTNC